MSRMRIRTLYLLFSSIYLRTSLEIRKEPIRLRKKKKPTFINGKAPAIITVEDEVKEEIAT